MTATVTAVDRTRAGRDRAYAAVNERILELLDAGTVPWRKPWNGGVGAAFRPRNYTSGRPYRGMNLMLLSALGYEDPRFLTMNQANKLGGRIRKGSRSIPVLLWKPAHKRTTDDDGIERSETYLITRLYRVFPIGCVEGIDVRPLPAPPAGHEHDPIASADAIVHGYRGRPSVGHDGGGRAFYRPVTDTVHMPALAAFDSPHDYYATLLHELAHSTGHPRRLARWESLDDLRPFGTPEYSREELVAEMTASYLMGVAGIEAPVIANSAAYIDGWRRKIEDDPRCVINAAQAAQKAADHILGPEDDDQDADD